MEPNHEPSSQLNSEPNRTRKFPKLTKVELRSSLYRSRYLVPNLVTVGNLFCGFLCIIYASSDRFERAVIAIGLALLLDGLDGRVARKLNATSKFGVEFDSFSDFISFGIAPAMLIYHWCFRTVADEFGVLVTFVYCLCAASRLARFNIASENLKSFVGLPSPGAAGMVVAVVNLIPRHVPSIPSAIAISVMMVMLGYLMVSKIEFFSIKLLKLDRSHLPMKILLGAVIGLIWYNSGWGFVVLVSLYVLSGPYNWLRGRRARTTAGAPSETTGSLGQGGI